MMPKGEREVGDGLQIIKPNMLAGASKITSYTCLVPEEKSGREKNFTN